MSCTRFNLIHGKFKSNFTLYFKSNPRGSGTYDDIEKPKQKNSKREEFFSVTHARDTTSNRKDDDDAGYQVIESLNGFICPKHDQPNVYRS